jgi:chemotaxis protein MotB
VRRTDFWIEVEIRTDILFPSGSAQLAPYAIDVINRLGGVLAPFQNPIRVEGHTDNVPISTVAFYSNWELSAARAGSVVRVLAKNGVGPGRLAVIGFGEQRPVQSNDTSQGRNANRRVVIVILSTELTRHNDPAELPAPPSSAPPGQTPPVETAPLQTAADAPAPQSQSVAVLTRSAVKAAVNVLSPGGQPEGGGTVPAP